MRLMRFDVFEGVRPRSEVSKRVEAEVANVRLLGGDESREEDRSGADKWRTGIQVYRKADRLKKNGSLRVIMLHVSRLFGTVFHNGLQDLKQCGPDSWII